MNRSITSSNFPDVNVWLALIVSSHVHAAAARRWFERSERQQFYFCRFTQIGLLRLLTTQAVMQDRVLGMKGAWKVWLRCLEDDRIQFLNEPSGMETEFRRQTGLRQSSPKLWADGYLAAFAVCAGLTVITFDKGLQTRRVPCIVLDGSL